MWRPTQQQKATRENRSYIKDGALQESDDQESVVESLDQLTAEHEWSLLLLSGPLPIPRSKHAAVVVGRRMFVCGGTSAQGSLNDVQVLHAEKLTWLQLGCWSPLSNLNPMKEEKPDAHCPRCTGHSMAFWDKQLVVVGCQAESTSKAITAFSLDLGSLSWSTLSPKGDVPAARTGQSTVQVGSMMVMFGGEDRKGRMLNDIYIFDLKAQVWLPLKTSGSKPSPRRDHSAAAYCERYLWIFGGKSRTSFYNDAYYLDFQSMEWTKEKTKGLSPTARAGHSGVIAGDTWYIVGGEFRGNEVLEMLALDMESHEWSVVAIVRPGSPLANDGVSLVKVRSKGRVYLIAFGGHDALPSNQVYVMLLPSSNKQIVQRCGAEISSDTFSSLSTSFNCTAHPVQPAVAKDPLSPHSVRTSNASSGDAVDSAPESSYYMGDHSSRQSLNTNGAVDRAFDHQQEASSMGNTERMFASRDPSTAANDAEASYWMHGGGHDEQSRLAEEMQLIHLGESIRRPGSRSSNSGELSGDGRHSLICTGRDLDPGPRQNGKHDMEYNNADLHERLYAAIKLNEDLRNRLVQTWNTKVELEHALNATLMEKDEIDRRFSSALINTDVLEQQVRCLLKSKADGERRLQESHRNLEEAERKLASSSRLQEDAETRLRSTLRAKEDIERHLSHQSKTFEESPDEYGYAAVDRDTIMEQQMRLEELETKLAAALNAQSLAESKLITAARERRELNEKATTAMYMMEEARTVSKNGRAENLRLEHDLLAVKALLRDAQEELQAKEVELGQAKARNFELQVEMYELSQKFTS